MTRTGHSSIIICWVSLHMFCAALAILALKPHPVVAFEDGFMSNSQKNFFFSDFAVGDNGDNSEYSGHRINLIKRAAQGIRDRAGRQGVFLGHKEPFSLNEIVKNEYTAERWNGTWVSDSEFAYRSADGDLAIFNLQTRKSRVLVPSNVMLKPERVFKFWISPDRNYVLLAIRPQKLFRHSFIAMYDVYHVVSGKRLPLQPGDIPLSDPFSLEEGADELLGGPQDVGGGRPPSRNNFQVPLMYATWSPTGNSLAYVFANNIYYRRSPEEPDFPVTNSGVPGTIFNGVADWVYEEEVISDTRALWFSPDSKKITWIEFNDTDVDLMPLQVFGPPGRLDFQYPIPTPLRYPKPGRNNPSVNVYVSDVSVSGGGGRGKSSLLAPPKYFDDKERLIYAVTWATATEVSLTWENRHQNYALVSVCDVSNVAAPFCKDALVMNSSTGWLELDEAPIFTSDGQQFAMKLSSEGYSHVNVINRKKNQRVPITSGKMVVTDIYHWDEQAHLIYFRATGVDGPDKRHLYTVTDLESSLVPPGIVTCLSCGVVNRRGGACTYNNFEFSLGRRSHYTMSCEGPHVPQDYLFQTNPNRRLVTLVNNNRLSERLSGKHLPKVSKLEVPIANGQYNATVRLYLPPDFTETGRRYPLLVNVYAGPNSQQINDRFKLDWGTYLTTSEGVIYAVIDGRGSGFRGDDLLHEIYYKLGGPEVQDQIDVTKYLIDKYRFIDTNKTAIWGWSYGGFVTLSALSKDINNVFKCGIAVAPVTNWIYYDTIYTERYLGLPTPDDNIKSYRDSDVTSVAAKLKGKKMLIVHGTADDNVHYQQSMMMTRALEEADVLFQQLSYPDENHGISGLRPHFYHSLSNFILNDCFGKNESFKR